MGYYMEQQEASFFIGKAHFPQMIKAIHALANTTNKMSGGSYSGGKTISKHYGWVDMTFVNSTNVEEIFSCWRWSVSFDEDGNINDIAFNGEKLGDDGVLFDAIAPFVSHNSFIEMRGEDNAMWRWKFAHGKCKEVYGKLVWEDE